MNLSWKGSSASDFVEEVSVTTELAKQISALSVPEIAAFIRELSDQFQKRAETGSPKESELMKVLAEHFGDAEAAGFTQADLEGSDIEAARFTND
jgi:hypothetical protein